MMILTSLIVILKFSFNFSLNSMLHCRATYEVTKSLPPIFKFVSILMQMIVDFPGCTTMLSAADFLFSSELLHFSSL